MVYKIIKGLFYLSSLLPLRVLYGLSDLLWPIAYYIVGYRRVVVRKNLVNSFPSLSEKEIIKIERKFYQFLCDYFVETIKLLSISKEGIKKRMTMSGVEELNKAFENHEFCFVYLGHYCNWEWMVTMPLWVDKDIHCAQLYHVLHSKTFDRLFFDIRERFGGENIEKYKALRRIVSMKKEGKKSIVGFISDQVPLSESIHEWVTFLNQDTGVFTGTERIGKKVNAAIFYGDVKRISRGRYHCTFKPITFSPNDFPDYRLTDEYMQLLEKTICENPPFWLWSHNRWKRQRKA